MPNSAYGSELAIRVFAQLLWYILKARQIEIERSVHVQSTNRGWKRRIKQSRNGSRLRRNLHLYQLFLCAIEGRTDSPIHRCACRYDVIAQ